MAPSEPVGATDATDLHRLAQERAALRRVASLVAEGATPQVLFDAVAQQVAEVLGAPLVSIARFEGDDAVTVVACHGPGSPIAATGSRWPAQAPTAVVRVRETRRPVRVDDYEELDGPIAELCRRHGVRSSVTVPISVPKHPIWGAITVSSTAPEPLPADTEERLTDFMALLAAAIADAEAREALQRVTDEQAAQLRVATLVAQGAPQSAVFAAIGTECAKLFGTDEYRLIRYEEGPSQVVVASSGETANPFPIGSRQPLGGNNTVTRVFETGRPARIDDYSKQADGAIGSAVRFAGVASVVATPVRINGRLWGALGMAGLEAPLPPDSEERLSKFTDLIAIAISNTESGNQLQRLAEEQAALRRVATLVARDAPEAEVFASIAEECLQLFGSEEIRLMRYEDGPGQVVVASSGDLAEPLPVGLRTPLGGVNGATLVYETGRPARIDDYDQVATGPLGDKLAPTGVRCVVATPITVEGRLWGALGAATRKPALPRDIESRLGQFTELLGIAIANTETRARERRLADEQAALRRVATLVAQEAPAEEIFDHVAREVAALLDVERAAIVHDQGPGHGVVVGSWGDGLVNGQRVGLDDGAPAGLPAGIASPVTVDGRTWGVMAVGAPADGTLPADAEARIAKFADLVAASIANIQARADLAASRARVVAASDESRRQIERDLHDGAQQRLVETVLKLKVARDAATTDVGSVPSLIDEAVDSAERAIDELRELVHGILPPILAQSGLRPALRSLARRMPVAVKAEIDVPRLTDDVEATAYFVAAEALTNVAKHAGATAATVRAGVVDGALRLTVQDDGAGGARPDGRGLIGLADRLAVFNGRLQLDSPPGGGTTLTATIPLAPPARARARSGGRLSAGRSSTSW